MGLQAAFVRKETIMDALVLRIVLRHSLPAWMCRIAMVIMELVRSVRYGVAPVREAIQILKDP